MFTDYFPYALLSMGQPQSMLVYAADGYEIIDEWHPYEDCLERTELEPERFIASYHGDKNYIRALVNAAADALRSHRP